MLVLSFNGEFLISFGGPSVLFFILNEFNFGMLNFFAAFGNDLSSYLPQVEKAREKSNMKQKNT